MRLSEALEKIAAGELLSIITLDSFDISEKPLLAMLIINHTGLKKLQFNDIFFTTEKCKKLGEALGQHKGIEEVVFEDCNFELDSMAFLSQGLGNNRSIQKVQINLLINDDDASALLSALAKITTLREITIDTSTNIAEKFAAALAKLIQSTNNPLRINLTNSCVTADLSQVITACEQQSQPIVWNLSDTDNTENNMQIARLAKLSDQDQQRINLSDQINKLATLSIFSHLGSLNINNSRFELHPVSQISKNLKP